MYVLHGQYKLQHLHSLTTSLITCRRCDDVITVYMMGLQTNVVFTSLFSPFSNIEFSAGHIEGS